MSECAAVEKYRTGGQETWVLVAGLLWTLRITLVKVQNVRVYLSTGGS